MSKQTLLMFFVFFCSFPTTFSFAEDQRAEPILVITPTRNETALENIGRSVELRTAEEIEQQNTNKLSDAVQTISGLRYVDIGGPGSPGTTPVEIRGVRTGGTQLLLDGMALSDPSSISGTYEQFFSFLTTDDLAAIEVLKGSTGVLYGSDSQGGTINLITKKPSNGYEASGRFEVGSFDTYTENLFLNAGSRKNGLVASTTRIDSQGMDAHGDYTNTTATVNGHYEIIPDHLTISPLFRIINAGNDLDTDPSVDEFGKIIPNQDTEKNHVDARGYFLGLTTDYKYDDNNKTTARIYTNNIKRDFFFEFFGFGDNSVFKGEALNVDLNHIITIPQINTELVTGVEFEHQVSKTDAGGVADKSQRDQYAIFLNDQTDFFNKILRISAGARLTAISNNSATVPTLEGSAVLKIPQSNSRLHSSIAQGFRAPTLFESNGKLVDFDTGELVNVGNQGLEEEESLSIDFGIEQPILKDIVTIDVTAFQIESDQTILFDFPNQTHRNGGGIKTQGIESSLSFRPCSEFFARAAYTYLGKAEGLDDQRRQRTPKNWFDILALTSFGKFSFSSELRFRDQQEIQFFGIPQRAKESSAMIFNASANYSLNKHLELFLRAENLFDKDYTEAGFSMPGASAYGGVKWKL